MGQHWMAHQDRWWAGVDAPQGPAGWISVDDEERILAADLREAERIGLLDATAGCEDEGAAIELLWDARSLDARLAKRDAEFERRCVELAGANALVGTPHQGCVIPPDYDWPASRCVCGKQVDEDEYEWIVARFEVSLAELRFGGE